MTAFVRTSLVEGPLDPRAIEDAARDPHCGALASFVGVVRDHDGGADVVGIDYSAHPLAAEALAEVASEFADRVGVHRIEVHHRVGGLRVGDEAMVVAVAAEHRAQAFSTISAIVDEVKARVPIWKKQYLLDGSHEWSGLP